MTLLRNKLFGTVLSAGALVLLHAFTAFPSPEILVDKDTIDIGTVVESREDTIPVVFKLINVGDAPLGVSSVRTNCGCVVAGYDTVTPPGDTCRIYADFFPTGLSSGPFEKLISVTSNASTSQRRQFVITGVMQAHIDISKKLLELPVEDSIPAPLILETRKADLAIDSVGFIPVDDIEGDPLPLQHKFHALDSTRADGYHIYRLNIYNSQGLTGPMFGVFVMKTNHEAKQEIKIRGSIERFQPE